MTNIIKGFGLKLVFEDKVYNLSNNDHFKYIRVNKDSNKIKKAYHRHYFMVITSQTNFYFDKYDEAVDYALNELKTTPYEILEYNGWASNTKKVENYDFDILEEIE